MLVIPVPPLVYLLFLIALSVVWGIWVVSDLVKKGLSKYSIKRVLTYIGSGAVLGFLWAIYLA